MNVITILWAFTLVSSLSLTIEAAPFAFPPGGGYGWYPSGHAVLPPSVDNVKVVYFKYGLAEPREFYGGGYGGGGYGGGGGYPGGGFGGVGYDFEPERIYQGGYEQGKEDAREVPVEGVLGVFEGGVVGLWKGIEYPPVIGEEVVDHEEEKGTEELVDGKKEDESVMKAEKELGVHEEEEKKDSKEEDGHIVTDEVKQETEKGTQPEGGDKHEEVVENEKSGEVKQEEVGGDVENVEDKQDEAGGNMVSGEVKHEEDGGNVASGEVKQEEVGGNVASGEVKQEEAGETVGEGGDEKQEEVGGNLDGGEGKQENFDVDADEISDVDIRKKENVEESTTKTSDEDNKESGISISSEGQEKESDTHAPTDTKAEKIEEEKGAGDTESVPVHSDVMPTHEDVTVAVPHATTDGVEVTTEDVNNSSSGESGGESGESGESGENSESSRSEV